MKIVQKVISLWLRWSDFGTHFFPSESGKKYRRIQNQLILVFIGAMVSLNTVIAFLALAYRTNDSGILLRYLMVYQLPSAAMLVFLVISLLSMRRTATSYPMVKALVAGVLFIGLLGIAQQPEALFYLYNLALLPIPYIAVPRSQRLHRRVATIVTVGIVFMVMSSHWFLANSSPLLPLPEQWMVKVVSYVTVFSLLMTLAAYFQYIWRQNTATEENLETERKKSDKLLLNILPQHVAEELKEFGNTKPVLFDSATVMFTDFVGFTRIAEQLSPEELIAELDRCFSYFDSVCTRHSLEKLKTIGDAYMCAGGVPVANRTHAVDCCLAALDIQAFMNALKKNCEAEARPYWQLRLGLNSGHLVAGVIGEQKFSYDIWGDTVNTASRAESAGDAGRINMTGATYELVKDFFVCEYRGSIDVKNKKPLAMYFLTGIRPELSVNGEGQTPNTAFQKLYRSALG